MLSTFKDDHVTAQSLTRCLTHTVPHNSIQCVQILICIYLVLFIQVAFFHINARSTHGHKDATNLFHIRLHQGFHMIKETRQIPFHGPSTRMIHHFQFHSRMQCYIILLRVARYTPLRQLAPFLLGPQRSQNGSIRTLETLFPRLHVDVIPPQSSRSTATAKDLRGCAMTDIGVDIQFAQIGSVRSRHEGVREIGQWCEETAA
mmetsp:Transcript_17174/g.28537  ORF Transcript_17174/g.28537 Transcript_17174/m.28537 type:complete len:203 (+) Transcript_17174:309-917(+)